LKLVVFGLSVTSSWGNGHATLWRGLVRALGRAGHHVVFFERDVPWYAGHRDVDRLEGGTLRLYGTWDEAAARAEVADADAAIVTSYCPDAAAAARVVLDAPRAVRAFYDLDTGVTLARVGQGHAVEYLPPEGLAAFDLVLSYTGGRALDALRTRLGARRVLPLYGSVDPEVHQPSAPREAWRGALSYLGTYAEDRQEALRALFLEPAARSPERRFVLGGSLYPADFPWGPNVWYVPHVDPADHGSFYASSPLTLNVTRAAMAAYGWCPSGRLFEAAACGVAALSDDWEGLDHFFTPGEEILVARTPEDALAALDLGPAAHARLGARARDRALTHHSAARRAEELIDALDNTGRR
jgi:spore maturation protein CgeB